MLARSIAGILQWFMSNDLQVLLGRARVRIGQAAQLLRQPVAATATADDCLNTADALWRELVRRHEEEPDATTQVDGLRAEHVLERLNDVVYELLTTVAPASAPAVREASRLGGGTPPDRPPRRRRDFSC